MKKALVALLTGLLTFSAIPISANAAGTPSVAYCAHVQDIGWMGEVADGALAGTTGRSKRVEALKIHINGDSNLGVSYFLWRYFFLSGILTQYFLVKGDFFIHVRRNKEKWQRHRLDVCLCHFAVHRAAHLEEDGRRSDSAVAFGLYRVWNRRARDDRGVQVR